MIEKDLHDRLRNQNELDKRLLFDNAGDIGKHDGYADVGTIYSVKYDIISKKIEEESGRILVMILANLGQRSYNSRTTFPKYTDSVPKTSGQEHCPRGTS